MDKVLSGSAKYFEMNGGLRKLEYLMLNLPFKCNYACTKCCNYGRNEPMKSRPLSIAEIKSVIHEANELGFRVLVIAGEGEPLMDNNMREIVRSAHEYGMIPYIFTNGSLLDTSMAHFLKEQNASLIINMDSLEEEKYGALTGTRASFMVVHRNVESARRIFNDTFSTQRGYAVCRIAINMVVSHVNFNELESMIKFCGDDFALVFNVPMKAGRAKDNCAFSNTPEIEGRIAGVSAGAAPLGTTSDGKWCAYMRNGISIGSGGEILLCAYSLENPGIGNVRNGGIRPYIGKANAIVDNFYIKNGHSRCILRHLRYESLTESGRGG